MEQRPQQPPEGRLIADAAERMNLSIREAARRAGISYGRWRQITSGVQHVSPGNFAAVHAPARTLARMALVVGITPERMETEGQRPDAAEIMREAPAPVRETIASFRTTAEMEADMRPFVEEVRLRVTLARRHQPEGPLAGRRVFPLDVKSAALWDQVSAVGFRQEEGVIRGTAALMAWAAQEAAEEREGNSATGLIRGYFAGHHVRRKHYATMRT